MVYRRFRCGTRRERRLAKRKEPIGPRPEINEQKISEVAATVALSPRSGSLAPSGSPPPWQYETLAYLRAAQAYMLISMPTGTSTIFGVFQAISDLLSSGRHIAVTRNDRTGWERSQAGCRATHSNRTRATVAACQALIRSRPVGKPDPAEHGSPKNPDRNDYGRSEPAFRTHRGLVGDRAAFGHHVCRDQCQHEPNA
jgi:hypothetical protein